MMKKLLFILFSAGLASGAFAQSSAPAPVKKAKTAAEKQALKSDIKEKKADQKVVQKDLQHAQLKKAKTDHQEVKADKANVDKDAAKLSANGVSHPKAKARKEIKQESTTK